MTQLAVTVESAEFAKDFKYFITVQQEGSTEKLRTDISAATAQPVFSHNQFSFNVDLDAVEPVLLFAAFVVTGDEGQAKLLGESRLELAVLAPVLANAGSRQSLRFTRTHEETLVTVGKAVVSLKITGLQDPIVFDEGENVFHPLPAVKHTMDFVWRMKIQC